MSANRQNAMFIYGLFGNIRSHYCRFAEAIARGVRRGEAFKDMTLYRHVKQSDSMSARYLDATRDLQI